MLGLNPPQLFQHPRRDHLRTAAAQASGRRMASIEQQADGDQRRQRVTYHVQPQRFVPGVRQDGQLEGQARMSSQATRPARRSSSGSGRRRCDRRRTRVGRPPRSRAGTRPLAGARYRSAFSGCRPEEGRGASALGRDQLQGGDGQQRGRQVAGTVGGVAPAAVGVLRAGQPCHAGSDPVVASPGHCGQRAKPGADGRRRRQRRRGKPAFPKTAACIRCKSRRGPPRRRPDQAGRTAGHVARSRSGHCPLIAGPSAGATPAASSTEAPGRSPSVAAAVHGRRDTPAAAWLSR